MLSVSADPSYRDIVGNLVLGHVWKFTVPTKISGICQDIIIIEKISDTCTASFADAVFRKQGTYLPLIP